MEFAPGPESCPECREELSPILDLRRLQWESPDCSNCQRAELRKEIAKKHRELMAKRGVARRFLGADMANFPDSYRKLYDSAAGLFIHGPKGVGKTHLMAAIMKDEILRTPPREGYEAVNRYSRKVVRFHEPNSSSYPAIVSVPELLLEIRGTYDRGSAVNESDILDRHSDVATLMLDDLGTERPTDWALQNLYLIIDRRYRDTKRTFITSNLSLDELADRLDDRIASRIAGMCKVVNLKGGDRRIS